MANTTSFLHRRTLWTVGLVYLAVACAVNAAYQGPVQDWWKERGPVVRHDSFPADCTLCHLEGSWNKIREDFQFDHLVRTGHALEGAHAAAECLRCHNDRGPVALFADRGCSGCHQDPHVGRLGRNCDTCHGEENWEVFDFIAEHNQTRFPLVGAHAAAACWRCHEGAQVGDFTLADTDCATCHTEDLALATTPDHQAAGWTFGCDRCHVPTTWGGQGFSHAAFPLTGAHAAVSDCTDCHVGGVFSGTSPHCFSCHEGEYTATVDPAHAAAMFDTNCRLCHSTFAWTPAIFNHRWPLTGAHATVNDCADCHIGGVFAGTSTACSSCHQDNYNATTAPPHAGAGFGGNCESCHSTMAWLPAAFNHSWPLTGAHVAADCTQCHGGGVYVGTPTDCFSCHGAEYAATTNPNHTISGFGTTCDSCHTTSAWTPANFNHSFPTTGDHNLSCIDCHTTNMPPIFSCIDCHQHNQGDMFDVHDEDGITGYSWDSNACLNCHPDGKD